jgi:site-specific recombinase XerD
VATYADLVGRFVAFAGDKPLAEASFEDVMAYHSHLRRRRYHASSVCYMLVALRQFFKFWDLRGMLRWNHALVPVPKYLSTPWKPVDASEAGRMIAKVEGDGAKAARDRAMLSFLYASGVRVSELCRIRLGDILETGDRKYATVVSSKNDVRRMVFWDARTNALLAAWLAAREGIARTDHLFVSLGTKAKGKGMDARTVQRTVQAYRTAREVVPHGFRHGFGMRGVRSRVHLPHLQRLMGHKNLSGTQRYMDMYDSDLVEAYRGMEDKEGLS